MPHPSSLKRYRQYSLDILLFSFLSIAVCLILSNLDGRFRIKHVVVADTPIQGLKLEVLSKRSMIFSTKYQLRDEIVKANPLISQIDVEKVYPDTIALKLQWRAPIAVVKVLDGYIYLSADGVVVEKSAIEPVRALPIITYYQQFSFSQLDPGDILSMRDISDALYFYQLLRRQHFDIQRIDIHGFHMIGLYSVNQEFLISSDKPRDIQQYHLEGTIRLLKRQGKKFKKIDVRFDKPVVVLL